MPATIKFRWFHFFIAVCWRSSPRRRSRSSGPSAGRRRTTQLPWRGGGQLALRVPPPPEQPEVSAADHRVFVTTRALQGSWRWQQAARDANQSAAALLGDFSCAAGSSCRPSGRRISPHCWRRPARTARTSRRGPKHVPCGRGLHTVCRADLPAADNLGAKHDYPSGHAARGWTWELILAELLPERRAQLQSRAQALWREPGRLRRAQPDRRRWRACRRGHGRPVADDRSAFKADLQTASEELAALRGQGPMPARNCQSEARWRAILTDPSAKVAK